MANFAYTYGKGEILNGNIDFVNDDIRVMQVMTNTTADTEEDTDFIDQFTTLDEMDGANNARKALANQAVAVDNANDRAEFDADDVVWTALGNGTRQNAGVIIYKFVTNDADSIPIFWNDDGTPFSPAGNNNTYQWNAEGIGQAT